MPHDHGHGHDHGHDNGHGAHGHRHRHVDPEAGDRKVALAVAVNLALTVAQVAGGLVSGSVALIADAVHNFSDAISLIIAFVARRIARRPANDGMSFGYGRAELVAALVNYTTLVVIAVWLGFEAVTRLFDPPEVAGGIVIVLAGIALVIDLITAALTWRLAKHSANIRAAFLHNLADAATSVAVILGGLIIWLWDWRLADPLITLGISVWILWHALVEAGPVIRILMLGAPPEMETEELRRAIADEAGVAEVHHVHLWQVDERRTSLEAHLVLEDGVDFAEVVQRVKRVLAERFGVTHSTLEPECRAAGCADRARLGSAGH